MGGKIRRHRQRREYMAESLIWEFFRQACEALADLHAKKILHRDVKYEPGPASS